MKGRIYEASADFQLEAPSRREWDGNPFRRDTSSRTDWEVPVLVKMYPTKPKGEVIAILMFFDPSNQGHVDIVELGDHIFHATIFESGRAEFNQFVCREWSAIFRTFAEERLWKWYSITTLGWNPDVIYEKLASWIQFLTRERIEGFFRRIDGHKHTRSVTVDYYWQVQASD